MIARVGAASRSSLSKLRRCVEVWLLLSHGTASGGVMLLVATTVEAWRTASSSAVILKLFDDDRRLMDATPRLDPTAPV